MPVHAVQETDMARKESLVPGTTILTLTTMLSARESLGKPGARYNNPDIDNNVVSHG
jgi:hypothetical protein